MAKKEVKTDLWVASQLEKCKIPFNAQGSEVKENDVFIIGHGFYNKRPPTYKDGDFPFIGASGENNGVTGFTTLKDVENNSKIGYGYNEPIEKKFFPKVIFVSLIMDLLLVILIISQVNLRAHTM